MGLGGQQNIIEERRCYIYNKTKPNKKSNSWLKFGREKKRIETASFDVRRRAFVVCMCAIILHTKNIHQTIKIS